MWRLSIICCFYKFDFRTLGFCRRRVGRGGRIITDRAFHTNHQSIVENVTLNNSDSELIPFLPESSNSHMNQQVKCLPVICYWSNCAHKRYDKCWMTSRSCAFATSSPGNPGNGNGMPHPRKDSLRPPYFARFTTSRPTNVITYITYLRYGICITVSALHFAIPSDRKLLFCYLKNTFRVNSMNIAWCLSVTHRNTKSAMGVSGLSRTPMRPPYRKIYILLICKVSDRGHVSNLVVEFEKLHSLSVKQANKNFGPI